MLRQSRPSHGTVVAYLALFIALGGTAVAATGGNVILGKANSASSKTSLSAAISSTALQLTNTGTGTGATALGLNVASGHAPFTVNSPTKVANLNADRLDGQDSTAFGQVREFSHSIAAASAGPPPFGMVTFRGLTLSSESRLIPGPLLECDLVATTTDAGQIDDAWTFDTGSSATALASGSSTPVDHFFVARARGNGSRSVGQLVFHDNHTGRTLTVAYSVYGIPNADINGQGCTWRGTVTAAG